MQQRWLILHNKEAITHNVRCLEESTTLSRCGTITTGCHKEAITGNMYADKCTAHSHLRYRTTSTDALASWTSKLHMSQNVTHGISETSSSLYCAWSGRALAKSGHPRLPTLNRQSGGEVLFPEQNPAFAMHNRASTLPENNNKLLNPVAMIYSSLLKNLLSN